MTLSLDLLKRSNDVIGYFANAGQLPQKEWEICHAFSLRLSDLVKSEGGMVHYEKLLREMDSAGLSKMGSGAVELRSVTDSLARR
jgi:hypothetical protein